MNELIYTKRFQKSLKKIDKKEQLRIKNFTEELQLIKNPTSNHLLNVKKLSGMSDIYRFRVGNYRIVSEITEDNKITILVLDVFHRQQGYSLIKE